MPLRIVVVTAARSVSRIPCPFPFPKPHDGPFLDDLG